MKQLKTTTKTGIGRRSHGHIVYLNDEDGFGVCSAGGSGKSKHDHIITWVPGIPPEMDVDPQTGEEVEVSPGQPGYFMLEPSEEDGHSHEIIDLEVEFPLPEEDEQTIVGDVYSQFEFATDIELESVQEGDLSEEFYFGKQWDEDVASQLEKDSRACLTLNRIQGKVQELCGFEKEQRTMWRFTPVEGGDQKVADLLNLVTNLVCEQSYYDREKSKIFENQAIAGRGIFNVYLSRDRDLRGEIRVESFPWRDIRFGPHEKEDLSDCEFLLKHRMYSYAKLKQLWGEKADEIKFAYEQTPQTRGTISSDLTTNESYFDTQHLPMSVSGLPMADPVRKEYRVLERWQKIFFPTEVAVFDGDGFFHNCVGWSDSQIAQLKTMPGFRTVPVTVQKIRISTVCGGTLLSDQYPADLPVDDFFVVPAYGIKRGDRFQGKVALAIDAQRELNKRHSQAIDIGNRFITSGWFYDAGTFPEQSAKKNFIESSSRAGFMAEVTDISRPPVRAEGGAFPPMIVDLMNLADSRIEQLLSVTVESQGTHDSGSKLMQLQRMKMSGSEYLFDNLNFAQKKVAQLIVSMIQKFYTADRIYRMVAPKAQAQGATVGGQNFTEFSEEEIWEMLTTADLTQYDLMVGEQSYSATQREATFLILSELAAKGLQVSPKSLVRLAPMPQYEKDEMLAEMDAMAQAQAEAEQMKYQTELQKTAMAKGIPMPGTEQQPMPPASDQGVSMPPQGGVVAG